MAELPGIANWILAVPMLGLAVISFLWGLDLTITEVARERPWWRLPLLSGAFWLGQFFLTLSIGLFSVIGFLLLRRPNETAPLWFAAPAIYMFVACVAAFWLLNFTPARDAEEERGD